MPAPETVHQLVKRFEDNHDAYRLGKYNETQLRREFLDPFFETLGWDVFNKQGLAETYKDVIHEDSLEIYLERSQIAVFRRPFRGVETPAQYTEALRA